MSGKSKQTKQQQLNKDFFEAVNSNDEADVIVLLNLGAEIDYQDSRGNSATMMVCGNNNKNNKKMLELLLSHNANVNLQNKKGTTALMTAAINDCHRLIPYLIKANAELNLRNNNGDSALIIAAKEGHYYAFKALVEAGAKTDVTNNEGDSVFEIAQKKRKKTIYNYLKKNFDKKEIIQTGGDPFSGNAKTVFEYLNQKQFSDTQKNQEVIKMIQNNPNIVTDIDNNAKTILYYAIIYGAPVDIINAIIKANPKALEEYIYYINGNGNGRLPLQVAIIVKANIDVINALISAYPEAINMTDLKNNKTSWYVNQTQKDLNYYKGLQNAIEAGQQLLSSGSGGSPSATTSGSPVVSENDPYTVALYKKADGKLGIGIDSTNSGLYVVRIDNPNMINGQIHIGDYIVEVNGKPISDFGTDIKEIFAGFISEIEKSPQGNVITIKLIPDLQNRIDLPKEQASTETQIAPVSTETQIAPVVAKPIIVDKPEETRVPIPPERLEEYSSSTMPVATGPSVSSTSSVAPVINKKYLIDDPTLKQNQNVGTIMLQNGYKYYGPMNPAVIDDTSNPEYELLKISKQYGKILNPGGKTAKVSWNELLYDNTVTSHPSVPTNPAAVAVDIATVAAARASLPKDDWQWTDNYIIKQQYVTNDATVKDTDDNCIIIFTNGYIYEGPVSILSVDKSVPHYDITLLHISSKFGQIKNVNGDVIVKPTNVPLLAGTLVTTLTSATTATSNHFSPDWQDIMYDGNNPTASIMKLTGIWEWTDYFENYFSIPGLVMPDPNTEFSELMEQELIRRVDMDNIVFKTDNLEQMKAMLGHEIIVFGQAIISTLKYIYDNDIKAYTIANGKKKTCNQGSEEEKTSSEDDETNIEPSPLSTSPLSTSPLSTSLLSTSLLPGTPVSYDSAYKLYQAGQLTDCLAELDKIPVDSLDRNLSYKITLLKELCKIEQQQNTELTQEDGNKLLTTIASIAHNTSLDDNEILKLICNLYYYLYIGTLNNLLKDDIVDSDYNDESIMNNLKTLQLNTLANVFEKMGNEKKELQDKYRTAYINRLTAQDKDDYTKEVKDTVADASVAEKAEKWELAHILHERAHRYAVVYFGLDDTQFTSVIGGQKSDFLQRKQKATNDLTMTIKSLYKQLSMGKPGTAEPQSAFTTFYQNYVSETRGFNPNTIEDESKTAIKSILASVTKDETGVDFFRNMNKDIKVEDMNIYDLLLILVKNIILCLNVYLIVCSKIYREQPASSSLSPSIIVNYFQDLNLYYGFKQSYNKIMTALDNNRNNRSISIESGPEDIVRNNSAFTNMLLVTLATTLGLSGLTIATSGGSSSGRKKKTTRKRQYKENKKNKNGKLSRKSR
jgi:ankyrin repeat protein